MNAAPVIVPKSRDAWTQVSPFRVEHLDHRVGFRCLVYFDGAPEALEFAKIHTLFGKPCVVQSKVMPVTHEVRSFAPRVPTYVFWTKQFGDLETARDEFERGRADAMLSGGGYSLIDVTLATPIASYSKTVR